MKNEANLHVTPYHRGLEWGAGLAQRCVDVSSLTYQLCITSIVGETSKIFFKCTYQACWSWRFRWIGGTGGIGGSRSTVSTNSTGSTESTWPRKSPNQPHKSGCIRGVFRHPPSSQRVWHKWSKIRVWISEILMKMNWSGELNQKRYERKMSWKRNTTTWWNEWRISKAEKWLNSQQKKGAGAWLSAMPINRSNLAVSTSTTDSGASCTFNTVSLCPPVSSYVLSQKYHTNMWNHKEDTTQLLQSMRSCQVGLNSRHFKTLETAKIVLTFLLISQE